MKTTYFWPVICFGLFASAQSHAAVGASSNWGLGYGSAAQEFGTKEFDPKSVAGHAEIQVTLWKFLLGVGYATVTNYNIGDERNYVSMGHVHAGFNLSPSVQLIGGVGAGKWRRRRENQVSAPMDYDYSATGTGYVAGLRVFLYNSSKVSVGLSGTYFRMSSDKYHSVEDSVSQDMTAASVGHGQLVALVVRLSLDDVKKLSTK